MISSTSIKSFWWEASGTVGASQLLKLGVVGSNKCLKSEVEDLGETQNCCLIYVLWIGFFFFFTPDEWSIHLKNPLHYSKKSRTGRLKSCSGSSTTSDERSISPASFGTQDVKFTKQKGFTKDACACIVVTVVLIVLGAAAAIYFGLQYLDSSKRDDVVYKGTFRVLEGDRYNTRYADSLSREFRSRAEFYESKLNALFNSSQVKEAFMKSEILALDKNEKNELIVHFNLHTRASLKKEIGAADIYIVLANEVVQGKYSNHLQDIIIDQESIEIVERSPYASKVKDTWGPRVQIPGLLEGQIQTTKATKAPSPLSTFPPRKCESKRLKLCAKMLPFNLTSFPNLVGHLNYAEVMRDLVLYRQISDSECFAAAPHFICHLLQPECIDDNAIMPCKSFCTEFWNSCKNYIPDSVKSKINCDNFPRYTKKGSCWTKPGCVKDLRDSGRDDRICDGIIDCADKSDEFSCDSCKVGKFMCGDGHCVNMSQRCDNRLDCANGADESGCLSLSPSISSASVEYPLFHSEGYLIYNEAGFLGKICTDSLNNSLPTNRLDVVLRSLATTTCELLGFQSTKNIEMRKDTDKDHKAFVQMVDPLSSEVKFVRSPCPSRHVLYLRCSHLECGRRPAHSSLEDVSRNGQMNGYRSVFETDWPWHATLIHAHKPKCDATIVDQRWLLTSSKCFQGSPGTEWNALFGSVRHSSHSPRHLVIPVSGVVKSPFHEQNDIVLVQLQKKITYSNQVLPVCLTTKSGNSSDDKLMVPNGQCVTLGWDQEGDRLQEIYVQIVNPARCTLTKNKEHKICVEYLMPNSIHSSCKGKIQTGRPLMCNSNGKWFLAGVDNDSTCQNSPRLLNKVSPISQWVYKTISALNG
ncbi:Atrial natriuretic peptide-converting enzyme [Nymphon striatum]|nr:Atrial natriuretic peptide-converting enzyme [Nymphon striatum]